MNEYNRTFHIQGIAWDSGKNRTLDTGKECVVNGIGVSVEGNGEEWGESLSFRLQNTTDKSRKLKVFFLVEWLSCKEDTIGIVSFGKDIFWNYGGRNLAATNIVSTADSVKKTIYPLNLKGLQLWRKSLKEGSLYYYPITNGQNMMVYMLDFSLEPFERKSGSVYGIEGALKEEVINLDERMKNRLAFPSEK
ncbi:hypothetical protein ABER02_17795 [Rossellomorea marisflavi]|uniref:hypothetical protein n=1 Tax=Rossellomorea marisflavi TaxID=189381 RepID=UPI00064F8AFA|nr:hypothetical protein [Rossellomorea marisflavi]KML34705.1 hypothetical protein VL12_03050 [Rossellomorea marisflavi]